VPDQNSRLGNGPNWWSLSRPAPIPRCSVGGGSICAIAATLNDQRETVQLAKLQSLNFGECDGKMPDRGHARGLIRASAAPGGQDFMLGVLDECGGRRGGIPLSVVSAKNLGLSHAVRRPLQHQPRLLESW
jgi:hypothetical protein